MAQRLEVKARYESGGQPHTITVRGQQAKALLALNKAGPKGRAAQEVSTWAYRFSAYCYELKHKHGLSIRTDREKHEGGSHGRHTLLTPVEVLEVKRPERG